MIPNRFFSRFLIFNKNAEGVENAKIMKIGSCDAVMNVTVSLFQMNVSFDMLIIFLSING